MRRCHRSAAKVRAANCQTPLLRSALQAARNTQASPMAARGKRLAAAQAPVPEWAAAAARVEPVLDVASRLSVPGAAAPALAAAASERMVPADAARVEQVRGAAASLACSKSWDSVE